MGVFKYKCIETDSVVQEIRIPGLKILPGFYSLYIKICAICFQTLKQQMAWLSNIVASLWSVKKREKSRTRNIKKCCPNKYNIKNELKSRQPQSRFSAK